MYPLLNAKNYFLTALAILSLMSATIANSATLYDIEVIIFDSFNQGSQEHWPASPGMPDLQRATATLSQSANIPVARLLKSKRLGSIAQTLRKKGAVIYTHTRWRQSVKSRKTPQWLSVKNHGLNGLIQISRGRYLHVNTDLYLQKASARPYRIQLHRRMRSRETHYLDHPKLGIIVRAEPVAIAKPKTEAKPSPTLPTPAEPVKPEPKPNNNSLPRVLPDPS